MLSQKVDYREVSEYLRELADEIDAWGKPVTVCYFHVENRLKEGNPVQDRDGKWWATWEYLGRERVRIGLEMIEGMEDVD